MGADFGQLRIDCEHFKCGACGIASKHADRKVCVQPDACKACLSDRMPQTLNRVTASLAIKEIGRPLPDDKQYLRRYIQAYSDGPGTELKKIIEWFWSPAKQCAACSDRIRKMNKWGPEKCRKRKKLIVAWLRQSAGKNHLPFVESLANIAIERAISAAERHSDLRSSSKPVRFDHRWAVAVTAAPRQECTLWQCIASIRDAGWEPIVFAEPGSTITNATTVWNTSKLGVWHNWLKSVRWCLENTSAELILTVQDDSFFHPESKTFIERALWPASNAGFVSLYTPKHYTIRRDKTVRNPGINRIVTKSLWGACALVWHRSVLEEVARHPIAKRWTGARPKSGSRSVIENRKKNPHLIQNSDTAIGKIMNAMNKTMWFVDPSPVQHISRFSTIGHGDNSGRRNAWRIADLEKSLSEQIPIRHTESIGAKACDSIAVLR